MKRLRGVGVSPGIAVGPALVVEREAVPVFRLLLAPELSPLPWESEKTVTPESPRADRPVSKAAAGFAVPRAP